MVPAFGTPTKKTSTVNTLAVPVGAYHFTFIISDVVFAKHRHKTDHYRLLDNMPIVGLVTSSEEDK